VTAPLRGLFIFILGTALSGCIAPITAREARDIAHERLDKYCKGSCGTLAWNNTQKIKKRWLVDFDGQHQKYTVIVEADGNSNVTVWEKGVPAP
jgi:hypothetical protein